MSELSIIHSFLLCYHFIRELYNQLWLFFARLWRRDPCWYRNNQVSKLPPELPSQRGVFMADHCPWGKPPGDDLRQWFPNSRRDWDLPEQLYQGTSTEDRVLVGYLAVRKSFILESLTVYFGSKCTVYWEQISTWQQFLNQYVFSLRCGQVRPKTMRLCCQQAVDQWPQTPSSLHITSSQADSRPLKEPAEVSQPPSAPVRTKRTRHFMLWLWFNFECLWINLFLGKTSENISPSKDHFVHFGVGMSHERASPSKTQRKCDVFCSSGCGANFTAPTGRVVSPNYPADYPEYSNCNYTINAGEKAVIVLTFQTFQVEGKCL